MEEARWCVRGDVEETVRVSTHCEQEYINGVSEEAAAL